MPRDPKPHLISVCICTFQRPPMLARALECVTSQIVEAGFEYEVVVVDNDSRRSAEDTVRVLQSHCTQRIIYDCEPEQNIALARNRAIRNATGNLIAFIDDDEYPIEEWLSSLYRTMITYKADGVLGPVIPFFPPGAPDWLTKGRICDRRRMRTGTRLTTRDTRTGNVLLSRTILLKGNEWFDPAFGLTGGEDVDFFAKQIHAGRIFVWCDEAEAYETIPPARWKTAFHLRKYARAGTLNGERVRKSGSAGLREFLKSAFAAPIWLLLTFFSLPLGKHVWIRPALKFAYAGSCFSACCGISLVRLRD